MAMHALPDAEYLRECFSYEPETGILKWRKRPRNHFKSDKFHRISFMFAGTVTGCMNPVSGYLRANLDGKVRYNHRIIWKIMTGYDATDHVEHKNRNRADNRWINLREANQTQNNGNFPTRIDNKCGLKGVQQTRNGKYVARIKKYGVLTRYGPFLTKEEAYAAYCEAARKIHGEFWNPG